ncbi:hypothetical protein KIN20_028778 [Parelaphostrongylus tenuis]|uniref:RNA polymerase II subunit A C-terminal domain phosphatase SSU72 n=1 Tax=Parelaphostrongylus tenuis TaxID=148309 RepID=A0AAD5R1B5_PARTN|nr:hypothetical protein KIN20_028778 [Parelaphostrongylus tenuis]
MFSSHFETDKVPTYYLETDYTMVRTRSGKHETCDQLLPISRGVYHRVIWIGNQVKLPGTAIDKPNCYEFGKATYEYIYNDLKAKDAA